MPRGELRVLPSISLVACLLSPVRRPQGLYVFDLAATMLIRESVPSDLTSSRGYIREPEYWRETDLIADTASWGLESARVSIALCSGQFLYRKGLPRTAFVYNGTPCYPRSHFARLARPFTHPITASWLRMRGSRGTKSHHDSPASQPDSQAPAYIRQIDASSCTLTVHVKPGAKVNISRLTCKRRP